MLCQIEFLGKDIDADRFSDVIFNAVNEFAGIVLEKTDYKDIEASIESVETKTWTFYFENNNICNGPKERRIYTLDNVALCVSNVCHDVRILVENHNINKTRNFSYESENYCPLFKSEVLKLYCIKKNCVE